MRNQGSRSPRRKIGVKYCGGCGPKFDRVALVERIRNALSESWQFVSWEDKTADRILIVTGCETACVDPDPFLNQAVHWLNSEADELPTIEYLRRIHADSGFNQGLS